MTGTDSTLYGYLINRTIDTTEVTNIDNINSIINLVKGVDNLVKSVDSTVVHKGTSSSPSYETIYGTKYFAFEPGGAAAYTHKISLQPYESAGANKIVHTNNNGTTAYKLTLPDKNGTLAIIEDVASKANNSDVVHKGIAISPSNETIYGVKTFSEENGNSSVAINSTGINVSSTSNTFADIRYEAADDSCKVAASKNLNDGKGG